MGKPTKGFVKALEMLNTTARKPEICINDINLYLMINSEHDEYPELFPSIPNIGVFIVIKPSHLRNILKIMGLSNRKIAKIRGCKK